MNTVEPVAPLTADAFAVMFDAMPTAAVCCRVIFDGDEPVGSITEGKLFSELFTNPEIKNSPVRAIMQESFPVVDGTLPISEITSRFDKKTSAVLYKDTSGNYRILTKHDIIKALAD